MKYNVQSLEITLLINKFRQQLLLAQMVLENEVDFYIY